MSGLFSKPKTPEVKPPAPMPDDADPAILAADRRKRGQIMGRGGRASTILTDSLSGGSGDYTKEKMGQ